MALELLPYKQEQWSLRPCFLLSSFMDNIKLTYCYQSFHCCPMLTPCNRFIVLKKDAFYRAARWHMSLFRDCFLEEGRMVANRGFQKKTRCFHITITEKEDSTR